MFGKARHTMIPTVIRTDLPTPDAVIVRQPCGELVVVADPRVPDSFVETLMLEAPHCRDGRPLPRRFAA